MRKTTLTCLLLLFLDLLQAQTNSSYQIKAEYIYGNILKHTNHLINLVKDPIRGGEIAIEWQTFGEKPWHQYYNFPKFGVSLVGMDLGNPEMLGQLLAIYPYLNIKLIDTRYFKMNMKGGAGMSFLNKRFDNTATNLDLLVTGNAAIGSIVNVYFAGGANIEVPIISGISLLAGYNWNHASNGSFYQPNSGINMLNTTLGISYFPNYKQHKSPVKSQIASLPQKFTFELIASGGVRELYYRDDKMFPTGSLVLSAYRQLGNNLRLGVGMDGFYDGVYDGNTQFKRTNLTSNELKNKIRAGISIQPEFVFSKLTGGIHFGLYLYNPLRNLEPYADAMASTLNKPLIYKYDIEKEDGWLYTRVSLKYAFTQHLFLSLGLKTHLQKAEFIEWGLGYRF
jgi:hypothetical protein